MKNPNRSILLVITCLFFLCTVVLFLLRNYSKDPVLIQTASNYTRTEASAESTAFRPININSADIDELTQLPEIGPVLAQRIIDYRNEHGPFSSVGDLIDVPGIGEKRLELFWDMVIAD